MIAVMPQRKSLKLNITPEDKAIVQKLAAKEAMTEQALAGRIYRWFAAQQELTQRLILGQIPEQLRGAARKQLMQELADYEVDRSVDIGNEDDDDATGGSTAKSKPKPPKGDAPELRYTDDTIGHDPRVDEARNKAARNKSKK